MGYIQIITAILYSRSDIRGGKLKYPLGLVFYPAAI
jgi:hypothetical protein